MLALTAAAVTTGGVGMKENGVFIEYNITSIEVEDEIRNAFAIPKANEFYLKKQQAEGLYIPKSYRENKNEN